MGIITAIDMKVVKRIKLKNKKIYHLLSKAGKSYIEAMFVWMKRLIKYELIHTAYSNTWLILIWKRKGSALDLNMMRFVHTREWEAGLCEALVTEQMKPKIVKACPRIQICGMPKSTSTEDRVTVKAWMTKIEERRSNGVFQTFDLEKFFDKESLIDTVCTLKEKAEFSDKDYHLWYKLNENANIGVRTAVGDTETRRVQNSLA